MDGGLHTGEKGGGAAEIVVSRELQVPGTHPGVTSLLLRASIALCAHGMLAAICASTTALTDLQNCPAAPRRHPSSSEALTPWKSELSSLMLSANPPQFWMGCAGKINAQTDAKGWSKVLQSNLEHPGDGGGNLIYPVSIQCRFLALASCAHQCSMGGRAYGSGEKHTSNTLLSRMHKPKHSCFFEEPALPIDKMPSAAPQQPQTQGEITLILSQCIQSPPSIAVGAEAAATRSELPIPHGHTVLCVTQTGRTLSNNPKLGLVLFVCFQFLNLTGKYPNNRFSCRDLLSHRGGWPEPFIKNSLALPPGLAQQQ